MGRSKQSLAGLPLEALAKDGLAIRIQDQGIDTDDEQRLFQKFSRGKNAKGMHVNLSTGLGLYIAKKFVEACLPAMHAQAWQAGRRGNWITAVQKI